MKQILSRRYVQCLWRSACNAGLRRWAIASRTTTKARTNFVLRNQLYAFWLELFVFRKMLERSILAGFPHQVSWYPFEKLFARGFRISGILDTFRVLRNMNEAKLRSGLPIFERKRTRTSYSRFQLLWWLVRKIEICASWFEQMRFSGSPNLLDGSANQQEFWNHRNPVSLQTS